MVIFGKITGTLVFFGLKKRIYPKLASFKFHACLFSEPVQGLLTTLQCEDLSSDDFFSFFEDFADTNGIENGMIHGMIFFLASNERVFILKYFLKKVCM